MGSAEQGGLHRRGTWWVAEDQMLRDPAIGRPVNIIVHTLAEVNQALSRGESFWSDIHRDGVMLYELPGHPLNAPRPMTPRDAVSMAQRYFDQWLPKVEDSLAIADFCQSTGRLRDAAFNVHQAVERAYVCYLLVSSFYSPRSHNIKFPDRCRKTERRPWLRLGPARTGPIAGGLNCSSGPTSKPAIPISMTCHQTIWQRW